MFKNKEIEKFLEIKCKSQARIINSRLVEVIAPDGESFLIACQIGTYLSEETRKYELHVLEYIFDNCYSEDKEEMYNKIWRALHLNAITSFGMSPGNRQNDRIRIGTRIREIREEKGIEARDLAKLVGIDAGNLSKIENGKHSVGIDILSKIAAALGKKIDLVDI